MDEFVRQLDMKVLGNRLQKVRQHIGMKQSEVAAEIGCAPLTISRMERGETSTSLLPLLVNYSQTIDLNLLFGHDFNPDDEAVYNKNASLQTLVRERLKSLEDEAKSQFSSLQEEYNKGFTESIAEMFLKMNEEIAASTQRKTEELMKMLEQTIKLL